MIAYLSRVGIALSVLINVIILGRSNQTLSARNYELKRHGHTNLVYIIDKICYLDEDHCQNSWIYWITRKDVAHLIEKDELIWLKVKDQAALKKFQLEFIRMSLLRRSTEFGQMYRRWRSS